MRISSATLLAERGDDRAAQLPLNIFATIMGDHAGTGMKDNIYCKRGEKVRSNADPVAKVVRITRELNREVATPSQIRGSTHFFKSAKPKQL